MSSPPPGPFAISVEGLDKEFRLPHEQVHTLKERLVHPLRRTSYDRLRALEAVSFHVEEGEFFGIVGRNGSGKSTLLKCLAGIYRADTGSIWLRGRMAPFIELGVGFNPDLAARDNVLINAIMLGLTRAEAQARYERIVAFAELEDFVDLKLKNYSSGMQVRLAFSVMVQVDADVLLIDEVLAVGDAAFQQKCNDTFNRMRDEGRTIVLVTHDMGAVERFCHRAMLLDKGRIVSIGDPHDIALRYNELNFNYAAHATAEEDDDAPRLGDGAARIVDAWFADGQGRRVEVLEQGVPLTFGMRVRVESPIEDPVLGVTLLDGQRRKIFATNSAWTIERTGSFVAGDIIEFEMHTENVLAPGRYFATPAVARRGAGDSLMDLRESLVSLVVTGTRETGGLVDLPHDVSVHRVSAVEVEGAL